MNNLTKEEAITAMVMGEKLTHTTFTSEEWVSFKDNCIIFEDDTTCSVLAFWEDRTEAIWNDGWSVFNSTPTIEVLLTYFKDTTGKYYASGSYNSNKQNMLDIFHEVRALGHAGNLPDLVEGCRGFIVHVNCPDFNLNYPGLIIPPY